LKSLPGANRLPIGRYFLSTACPRSSKYTGSHASVSRPQR
jgi:hypothetical protein